MRKIIFFITYILISFTIIAIAFKTNQHILNKVIISAIMFFFLVALMDHYKEITD